LQRKDRWWFTKLDSSFRSFILNDGHRYYFTSNYVIKTSHSDEAGNKLRVNPKNKAELLLLILSLEMASVPNKLTLYYFHEGLGKWVEEAEAKLKDDYSVGDVEHFTFLNVS
jgi:hypothetical protein